MTNDDEEQQSFSSNASGVRADVRLPQPLLGRITLVLRYALDLPRHPNRQQKDKRRHVAIPLILPADHRLTRHMATVSTTRASAWEVALASTEGEWKQNNIGIEEDGIDGIRTVLSEKTNDRVNILPLVLTDRPKVESPDVIVDRALIQSQLGETTTRTRCLFVVQTTRPSLDLILPYPDATNVVEVRVDGRPTSHERIKGNRLRIPLNANSAAANGAGAATNGGAAIHHVELVLHGPGQLGAWRHVGLESPGFANGAVTRKVFWQIMTPSHIHLLASPKKWTREYVWRWDGLSARRIPVIDTRALVRWAGDEEWQQLPAGMNVYVFSSLEPGSPIEVSLISRSILVLFSSGFTLGIGLLLLYIPRMRQPVMLWTGATLMAAAAVWKTEFTILVAQGAGLGLLLGALALLLRRMLSTPPMHERISASESTAVRHHPGTMVVPTGRSPHRPTAADQPIATAANSPSPSMPSASASPTTTVTPTVAFPPSDSHR